MSADRKDLGKLPIHLVPVSSIRGLAEVLEFGAKKYSARNWEKGMAWSRCYNSAMRHLLAWQSGEDVDPESGLSHLKHALCNISFLIEYINTNKECDDRPIRGELAASLDRPLFVTIPSLSQNSVSRHETAVLIAGGRVFISDLNVGIEYNRSIDEIVIYSQYGTIDPKTHAEIKRIYSAAVVIFGGDNEII